jgi:predicted  nucleic acid-binding Zn-ribbon protein
MEVFNETIEIMDDKKQTMKNDFDEKKVKLTEIIEKAWSKKEALETKVAQLRKELERLNGQRINLFSAINNDEKSLS